MVHAQVEWTEEALGHLASIRSYIALHSAPAAERVSRRLREAADSLATFPRRCRPGPNNTRELPTIPPYIIIFEVKGNRVVILRIRHGRQQER